ncbi:MAG: hypothetical protein ACLPUG_10930 [Acidimicrobiales bacterium]
MSATDRTGDSSAPLARRRSAVWEAETEFNSAKRAALDEQIQVLVAQDAPYVALDHPSNIYAWQPSLHGFAVNPGGAYRLEDVWLD